MIGRTLSHYKVLEEISRGGMGIVYKALDLKLNREVALKVLPLELVADPERKRRFVHEAQAAAALKHPHIGVIYEIDEAHGVDFIAMELIEGEKLSEKLTRGPLSLLDALRIGTEVAEGLANAHDKGIVHRDIKPANIMRSREGHAKIIDFGLAKLIEPVDNAESFAETVERRETVAGALLGTIHYMSPEQARGQTIDHRSDIFSFGVLLYEMLSGQRPFEGSTAADTLGAILNQPPKPLPTNIPKSVRRVLERCLQKEPERRFSNATDLARSLQDAEAFLGRGHSKGRLLVAASLAAATVAAGTWWFGLHRTSLPQPPHEVLSVLIADFDNRTGERRHSDLSRHPRGLLLPRPEPRGPGKPTRSGGILSDLPANQRARRRHRADQRCEAASRPDAVRELNQ